MTALREPDSVIKSYFNKYDTDHNGYLDAKEFTAVCQDMGVMLEPLEVQAAFHKLDQSANDKIHLTEFIEWWHHPDRAKILEVADNPVVQSAIEYFKRYDVNGTGSLNLNEFQKLCVDLNWSTDNISNALKSLDENQDGVIDFNEFLNWLRWEGL